MTTVEAQTDLKATLIRLQADLQALADKSRIRSIQHESDTLAFLAGGRAFGYQDAANRLGLVIEGMER